MLHHKDLEIHQREDQGVVILDLHGKIEMGRGDIALREFVQTLLDQGNRQLVLNMAQVSAVDTAGAGVLLFLSDEYRAQGGKLVLLKVDKVHAEIYEVARLETVMEICPDEIDAVNSFFPDRAVAHYDILDYVETSHEDRQKIRPCRWRNTAGSEISTSPRSRKEHARAAVRPTISRTSSKSIKPRICITISAWSGAAFCFPGPCPKGRRSILRSSDWPLAWRIIRSNTANFEGVIPAGEYGGGTVMLWDRGTWTPEVADVDAALEKGDLKFTLLGKKLRGSWVLVRTKLGYGGSKKPQWLLIKHRDRYASTEDVLIEEAALGAHQSLAGRNRAR